jgi:hypothetical protein
MSVFVAGEEQTVRAEYQALKTENTLNFIWASWATSR